MVARLQTRCEDYMLIVRLSRTAAAVREARHLVADFCRRRGWHKVIDTAVLLTSELTSNAVRHCGGESIVLALTRLPGRLVVAVSDSCISPPYLVQPRPGQAGGRGLQLVDQLAERWDYRIDPAGAGKTVRFVMIADPGVA